MSGPAVCRALVSTAFESAEAAGNEVFRRCGLRPMAVLR